jgi:hypothetical protein
MESSYGFRGRRCVGAIQSCETGAPRSETQAQPAGVRYGPIEELEAGHPLAQPRDVGVHPVGKDIQPLCGIEPSSCGVDQLARRPGGVLVGRPLEALDRVFQAVAGAHQLLGGFDEPARNAQQLIRRLDRPRPGPALRRNDHAMAVVDQTDRRIDGPPHAAEGPRPRVARTPIHPARNARVDSGGGPFARARHTRNRMHPSRPFVSSHVCHTGRKYFPCLHFKGLSGIDLWKGCQISVTLTKTTSPAFVSKHLAESSVGTGTPAFS